jgi:hypothetical protein
MDRTRRLFFFLLTIPFFTVTPSVNAQEKVNAQHVIVYHGADRFAGWPANNAAAIFPGDEIVVGFIEGAVEVGDGHNLAEGYTNWLARSRDGGLTWSCQDPEGYVGDFGDRPELQKLQKPVNFTKPGFMMRVVGTGYHGATDPRAHFFWSGDRGQTWKGPYAFSGIDLSEGTEAYNLTERTPRTDYIVQGRRECILFFSAREKGVFGSDRLFCIQTTDGGKRFEFLGWVEKPYDPADTSGTRKVNLYDDASRNPFATECRAVMASSLLADDGTIYTAVRRKYIVNGGTDRHWIDLYVSFDGGRTWKFRSWVCDTGPGNGNPPALEMTDEGRLCVVYGNRKTGTVNVVYSSDQGESWTDPQILMDGFWSEDMEFNDLGYPKLFRRSDGRMVAVFYYSTREHPHHLHASIWDPEQ